MLAPGPRSPAIWQTYRFIQDPHRFARELRARYGDVIALKALIGPGVAVLEASLAREVFAAPPEIFEQVSIIESLFGSHAVIAVAGERHRKLRKLLNPQFHGAQVRGFLTAMHGAVLRHLEALDEHARSHEVIALTDVTQAMALEVIIETVFGAGPVDRDALRSVLRDIIHSASPVLAAGNFLHKPWFPPWRRFARARAGFDRFVQRIITERRSLAASEGTTRQDVLGVILSARYDDGSGMSDAEIRDQLMTLLLAGHETSATAMAWSLYYLLRNPQVLQKLRDELDALGPSPSPEALTKVKYLDAVVSETLRIEPIATDVVRICREPFTIAGRYTVPKGGLVSVFLLSILSDPRVFPEPQRFRPERFLEKRFAASEFLPFGGGARRCLGAAFAEAELAIAVAEMISGWEFTLAGTRPERSVRRHLTMGPRDGVRVRVLGRRARPAVHATPRSVA